MTNAPLFPLCRDGRHRPRRPTLGDELGRRRTTCRDCGCALLQTGSMRKWFLAGRLA